MDPPVQIFQNIWTPLNIWTTCIETWGYIHNGADHWLVVTNIGVSISRDGVVWVYDSLYNCLTTSTELQIASIVNTSLPKIAVEFVDVQKQF